MSALDLCHVLLVLLSETALSLACKIFVWLINCVVSLALHLHVSFFPLTMDMVLEKHDISHGLASLPMCLISHLREGNSQEKRLDWIL